jgi:regulator of RNase E activity RraB
MREVFTRVEDDNLVHIEVATELEDFEKSHSWLFSVFIKYPYEKEDEAYYNFLETKEALILALELENRVTYAGLRVVDGWHELYFYAPNSKQLDALVAKHLQYSTYAYESNVVKDAKWEFYNHALYPSDLEFHHIQSAKIIFLLEEEGDILETPREVEHYVVFDTATQKERFITHAMACGYVHKDDLSTEDFAHGVALSKEHNVTKESLESIVTELYELATKEHGYYEGWSTLLAQES